MRLKRTLTVQILKALLCLQSCIPTIGYSQLYYPAGLGNANLKLWLTAADATTLLSAASTQASNGTNIARWSDKSGSGNHAVQATTASQPIVTTSLLNGFSGVVFNSPTPTQTLTGPSATFQTILAVRNISGTPSAAVGNQATVAHYQTLFCSPANMDFSIRGGGNSTAYGDATPYNSNDWPYGTLSPYTQWLNGVQTSAGSSANHVLVSARALATAGTYSISTTFGVGGNTGAYTRGMYGNDAVYEMLGISTTLNTTQRLLLENYLASMWGLTSSLPTASYTRFIPPTSSTYNRNLVGIGYTNGLDNFVTTATGSSDGLGFSSGVGAGDFAGSAGYIMAAHNSQANTILTGTSITGLSGTNYSRFNRTWYAQKFNGNSSGALSVVFNFNDYNGTVPGSMSTYSLLYNATDGSLTTGTNQLVTVTSTTISASAVTFVLPATNFSNGYYTLVWIPPVSLPINSVVFNAERKDAAVSLSWLVDGGNQSKQLILQRSEKGGLFAEINFQTPDTSGGSIYTGNYIDNDPCKGTNAYRLKLVNADGSFDFSPARLVDLSGSSVSGLAYYPNPVSDILHIQLKGSDEVESRFVIMTSNGATIYSGSLMPNQDFSVNTSAWPKGIYYLYCQTTLSKMKIIQFIKR